MGQLNIEQESAIRFLYSDAASKSGKRRKGRGARGEDKCRRVYSIAARVRITPPSSLSPRLVTTVPCVISTP